MTTPPENDQAAQQDTPDFEIGRYSLIEHLGTGAMGTVYLAEDKTLKRRVAIKLLKSEHLQRSDLRSRFRREARAVALINHVNVVQIFDIGEHDSHPYYVMEYLEGQDVGDLLKTYGRFSTPIAARVVHGAAAGLRQAAAADVVHRDVKPSNLVVTKRGDVKITDFGLAKAPPMATTGKLTATGATVGTPDYISPEQARGDALDWRADIYSLGCTLFHILTGHPPFRQTDEDVPYMEVISRHITRPAPRIDKQVQVEPEVADLAGRMMAKRRDERPSYDEVMAVLGPLAEQVEDPIEALESQQPPRSIPRRITAETVVESPPLEIVPPAETDARRAPSTDELMSIGQLNRAQRWPWIWAVVVVALVGTALATYLALSNRSATVAREDAGVASQSDVAKRPSPPKAPAGFVTVEIPGGTSLFVSKRPLSRQKALEIMPDLMLSPGDIARGMAFEQARKLASKLGYRLPSSREWPYLVAEPAVTIVGKPACEWVDDALLATAKQATCFARMKRHLRQAAQPQRDTIMRLVRAAR
jgi:serine/threonine protein kinase